jgi:hypothetical protein
VAAPPLGGLPAGGRPPPPPLLEAIADHLSVAATHLTAPPPRAVTGGPTA